MTNGYRPWSRRWTLTATSTAAFVASTASDGRAVARWAGIASPVVRPAASAVAASGVRASDEGVRGGCGVEGPGIGPTPVEPVTTSRPLGRDRSVSPRGDWSVVGGGATFGPATVNV